MTELLSCTDAELVSLISKGELNAFNEIYRRHWESLYRSAFNVLRDKDAVLDILQDVFIWVWEHRGDLTIRSLGGYLHNAVKYKVANYIRQGKAKTTLFMAIENVDAAGYVIDDILEVKELKAVIAQFTSDLPERCREIFTLSRMDYLTNREIAFRLGLSEKTVENQITIALKKLRLSLGRMSVWLFFFL